MIPDSVTAIGKEAFYKCSHLTHVVLPAALTNIGNSLFRDCGSLSSVVIPDGVESIGSYSFYGCGNLKSMTVPQSVTAIGNFAFSDCHRLSSFIYGGTQAQWEKIKLFPYWKTNSSIREIQFSQITQEETGDILQETCFSAADSEPFFYKVNTDGTSCTIQGVDACEDTQLSLPKSIHGYAVTGGAWMNLNIDAA